MNTPDSVRKTFCRICPMLCGLDVVTDDKKIQRVLPDKDNAYSWRDYCLKGGSAGKTRDHPKRLTTPMKRIGDRYVEVSYEQAVREIAAQLNDIRHEYGPNAIATYQGNPGGLNTTGAAFQGGFIAALGSTSNYTVGSVDQNNYHRVALEMYGCELTLLTPDVDHACCMLLIGMNPAVSTLSWMYTVPEGWNRVIAAQAQGADLIVVDPRETATTAKADTHVKIRPGQDWALLLAMIKVIFARGWEHVSDCSEANGVELIRAIAAEASLQDLANRCNLAVSLIENLAERFATAETAVCVAQTGVSQNRNGTLGEWLSHVLNLITGRVDRKGGRYYNPGIFKDTLKLLNKMTPKVEACSRIGGHHAIYGGYPLAILPDEIMTPGPGQVRALIINSGNPVVAGPQGARLDEALSKLDCLIAVDLFQRESHRHAHWLIPGTHFLEREDFLATLGGLFERPFAQLGQAVIRPRGNAVPEWRFFRDLAVAMGIPFMGVRGLNTFIRISRGIARCTGNPHHEFNPRWIWAFLVKAYGVVKWKDLNNKPSGFMYGEKTYGHLRCALQTPEKRIQAAPPDFVTALRSRLSEAATVASDAYPLQLVNQRNKSMMNSWLVESVKRKVSRGDVFEINPLDAAVRQIKDQQPVIVSSRVGSIRARARITGDVPAGIVNMDHGWGSRLFDPEGGSAPEVQGVNRNELVPADDIDELAGTPNLNGTWVNVRVANSEQSSYVVSATMEGMPDDNRQQE